MYYKTTIFNAIMNFKKYKAIWQLSTGQQLKHEHCIQSEGLSRDPVHPVHNSVARSQETSERRGDIRAALWPIVLRLIAIAMPSFKPEKPKTT